MKRIPLSPLFALAALPLLSASASTGVTPDTYTLSPDLTDSFAGTATGTSNDLNGYPASNAFDNNASPRAGRWLGVKESNDAIGWIRWDFADGAHVVRAYTFMSHVETDVSRAPTAWRLEGSNDGGQTWTTLDTVSGEGGWAQAVTRLYVFENATAYSSYRWTITAYGNGDKYFGLQESELYETASTESSSSGSWGDRQDITETIDPAVDDFETATDLTTPGVGTATASSEYSTFTGAGMFDDDLTTAAGRWLAVPLGLGTMPDLTDLHPGTVSGSPTHPDFTVAGAFDGNVSDMNGRWLGTVQSGDEKAWLRWDFTDGPHAVGGYGFQAAVTGSTYGDTERSPVEWTLSGSNDGGATWTSIDSVSGPRLWKTGEPRLYFTENRTAYSSYRFSFTDNVSSDYIALTEIELYSSEDVATNATGRAWVQLELPEAIRPNGYVLHSTPTASGERCPTAWRLLASNDGAAWTVLDRRTRQGAWGGTESRRFDFENGTAFRFWRLVLDGDGGNAQARDNLGYLAFSELELFDYDSGRAAGTSRVRSSPTYDNGSDRHCIGTKAFDGDLTTGAGEWMALVQDEAEKAWVSYRFDRKVYVDGYGLAAYADSVRAPIRSPSRWTLYGSNDGGRSWTELDSRRKSAWTPGEKCIYDAASPGRYSLYKFSVTGRGSDSSYVGLQEIELYGSLSSGTVIVVR